MWHWWSAGILHSCMCCDPVSVASWPHAAPREPVGQADGTSCWWMRIQWAHCCGLLQQSLPRDSADGEHQSCAWHIRTARMWVEVISNEFCLIYGTNAFSTLHECSLSIHGAIEHSLFRFKFSFFSSLVFKEMLRFFFFFFWAWISTIQTSAQWQATSPTLEKGPMCLKHLGRSIFLISSSAVNSADQKVDQRLPGDRHLRLPPAEDRERN